MTVFKGVVRSILRDRLLSTVGISGMIVGLCAGLLILAFAAHEYAHDAFHERSDRIYRVDPVVVTDGEATRWADSPYRLRDEIESSFPQAARVSRFGSTFGVVRAGAGAEYQMFTLVDPDFLDMFSFEMIEGNPVTALSAPGSMVVTETAAERFFQGDALGRTLSVKLEEDFVEYTVSGVIVDPPLTSSLDFEILLPFEQGVSKANYERFYDRWRGQAATFVELETDASAEQLVDGLDGLVEQHGEQMLDGRDEISFQLTALEDIYFDQTASTMGLTRTASPRTAMTLLGLGLLIILIAASNFTTFSIAASTRQSRAVGIRKAIGASRFSIAVEYVSQSLLKTVVAAILGFVLALVLAQPFSTLVGSTLDISLLLEPAYGVAFLGLVVLTGLLAGAYPAFDLARLDPSRILTGHQIRRKTPYIIRGIVVVQFAATAVLLLFAFTMSSQVQYLNNIDLGLDTENVLVVRPDYTNSATVPAVDQALRTTGQTSAITDIARTAGMIHSSFGTIEIPAGDEAVRVRSISVTPEFLTLLGIDVVAGNVFSPDSPGEILVNRPLAELIREGEPLNAVGQTLPEGRRITGITSDFYPHSARSELRPFALMPLPQDAAGGFLTVRAAADREAEAVQAVRDAWTSVAPDVPLQYYWLDEELAQQAGSAQRWTDVLQMATLFALLVACLGLFGLSALTAARRRKELSIRKVLGASSIRLSGLLVRETAVLIAFASLLALAPGFWLTNRWLQNFGNRISLGAVDLALVVLVMVAVAVLTVSVHAMRASLVNPADNLHRE